MATQRFSNVLILTGCSHATVNLYRGGHLQEQLAQLGIQAEVQAWQDQAWPAAAVEPYDLLVLQRTAMSANLACLIDAMHRAGKLVLFDTDDLVFEPTMIGWHRGAAQLPPAEQSLYVEGVHRTLATLEASDAVLAASPLLVELASRRGKPAFLHRNAVGVEMQTLGDRLYARRAVADTGNAPGNDMERAQLSNGGGQDEERVIIGYGSGTPTHDVDFAEVVPALLDLLSRHPQVELWLMGPLTTPEALQLLSRRIRRFPLMGWQAYLELAAGLDIMLAPLEADNLFCRAKSEIKFVEAALLGIPTVATRTDPFEGVIQSGVNGLLAGATAEWIAALDRLVSQPGLRRQLGAAARQTVEKGYSLATRATELAETLNLIGQISPSRRQLEAYLPRALATQQTEQSNPVPASNHIAPVAQPAAGDHPVGVSVEAGPPLVLNWLVTEPFRGSGGHLGVFRMIQHLVEFGHECHVYVAPMEQMYDWPAEKIGSFVDQNILRSGAQFHRWTGRTGAADATIATYWSTVADVARLPNPGQRYYLVQDFEPYFYPMGTAYLQAEHTYRQGFHCLTLGPWLAKLLRERYDATADSFDFAVDREIYSPQALPRAQHPRVAFYARPSTPRRAYELGIAALEIVKRRHPAVEVILFGADQAPTPPFAATTLGVRSPYELAALYSSCDVGLVLSLTNPSFVPFEMMACRCAVVDLRSERVEGLLVDRQTALLAEPTPESLADAVLELLWNKELHTAIVERAFEWTRQLSWQTSARQIERILLAQIPPAERQWARRIQGEDADSLLWQIHQLLDRQNDAKTQITDLETLLRRTLEEKAALAEQLSQTEAALQRAQTAKSGLTLLRDLPAQRLAASPLWISKQRLLVKLALNKAIVEQEFIATARELCAIELLFTPYDTKITGALHIRLHDLAQPANPLVQRSVLAAEIPTDRPFVLRFPPQPYSNGRIYRLALATSEDGVFAFAIWRYWTATKAGARLRRNGRPLRGELLFTLDYGEQALAPAHVEAPQPLAHVVSATSGRAERESSRLAKQTWHALRASGPLGLLRELSNYLRWQVGRWLQP